MPTAPAERLLPMALESADRSPRAKPQRRFARLAMAVRAPEASRRLRVRVWSELLPFGSHGNISAIPGPYETLPIDHAALPFSAPHGRDRPEPGFFRV